MKTRKEELQRRIRELEQREDNLTVEEKDELKRARQQFSDLEGEPASSSHAGQFPCTHDRARLGDLWCPTCGSKLPELPRSAVEQIVEEMLLRHGIGTEDAADSAPAQPTEEDLRRQYDAYVAAVKSGNPFKRKYHSFGSFKSASADERNAELSKVGLPVTWQPVKAGR